MEVELGGKGEDLELDTALSIAEGGDELTQGVWGVVGDEVGEVAEQPDDAGTGDRGGDGAEHRDELNKNLLHLSLCRLCRATQLSVVVV